MIAGIIMWSPTPIFLMMDDDNEFNFATNKTSSINNHISGFILRSKFYRQYAHYSPDDMDVVKMLKQRCVRTG